MSERAGGPFVNIVFDATAQKIIYEQVLPPASPDAATNVDASGLTVPVYRIVTDANGTRHMVFARGADEWGFRVEGNRLIITEGSVDVLSLGKTKPVVTGSRAGNAALASLLTALETMELITDNTTA